LVSLFNPFKQENQSPIKIAFAPYCENNITKILTESKKSQLYIADSSRVVQVVDYFQNIDDKKNNLVENIFIPVPASCERYFLERKRLLKKMLEAFNDNLKKYDIIIIDLSLLAETFKTNSFQNVVAAVKDFDDALKYFEMIVLQENAMMLLVSNDGRASQMSDSSSNSNLPLILISRETLNETKNVQGVQSEIMVDILRKKHLITDIAPTFLDLAGIVKPDIMKGESLVPLLNKGNL
jgi:2,3-bisphosphoglycerate-independent phosphoglycerate mutase